MIDRIRRWWSGCNPRSAKPETRFQADMRSARAYGVVQGREAHHAILRLKTAIRDGVTEYDELNRALFGRDSWPKRRRAANDGD